jgi:hypothetical protein
MGDMNSVMGSSASATGEETSKKTTAAKGSK